MKLFYMPGACSLAPHIVVAELGLPVELEKVNTREQRTESGADFRAINPKGYVPTLQLDDGAVLTEAAVILQFLADRKPDSTLMPRPGFLERYRVQEWLNYTSSELHKGWSPLFHGADADKDAAWKKLEPKLNFVEASLEGRDFLVGTNFTVADAYAFVVLNWHRPTKRDLSPWKNVSAFHKRVLARPATQQAMREEGLRVGTSA